MFKAMEDEHDPMADLTVVPKRIGGSLAVFIPADVARAEGIEEGKPVHLTVRPVPKRAEIFGLLKGRLGPYRSRAEEGDWPDE